VLFAHPDELQTTALPTESNLVEVLTRTIGASLEKLVKIIGEV
jgi:hypothetical protein